MTVREFIDKHLGMKDGFKVIAALTDRYLVDLWPEMKHFSLNGQEDKVLELRIFNSDEEHLLFRTDLGKPFTARMIRDTDDGAVLKVNGEERSGSQAWESFDEEQFLDIDAKQSAECRKEGKLREDGYITTSGGRYHLPFANATDARVKIRYYLSRYPETGQARIADWRVVEFMEGR